MNCSEERELITSLAFLLVLSSQALAGFISAVLSVIVIRKCRCLYFHINCRIIMSSLLLFYIAHSFFIGALQVLVLDEVPLYLRTKEQKVAQRQGVTSFFGVWTSAGSRPPRHGDSNDAIQVFRYLVYPYACDVGITPSLCFWLRFPATVCMVCCAALQFSMVVERAIALWKRENYENFSSKLGYTSAAVSRAMNKLLMKKVLVESYMQQEKQLFSEKIKQDRTPHLVKQPGRKQNAPFHYTVDALMLIVVPSFINVIVQFSFIASVAFTSWALRSDDFTQRTAYCSAATATSAGRVTVLVFSLCGVDVLTLIGILVLFILNGIALKRKIFNLHSSYQLRENIVVIRFILPLTLFQTVFYFLFSASTGIISLFQRYVSLITYRTLFAAFYVIPYYTAVAPILIWFIIKWSQQLRQSKLRRLKMRNTDEKETYFRTYAHMWNSGHSNKY